MIRPKYLVWVKDGGTWEARGDADLTEREAVKLASEMRAFGMLAKAYPVFEQDEIGADAADVVLGITPHALADQAASPHAGELAERVRMVESNCRAFFEPEGSDPEPEHVE